MSLNLRGARTDTKSVSFLPLFRKKEPWLPAPDQFYCRGCGSCCRTFVVTVSHFDIYRIIDHTGRQPLDFLHLVDADEEDDPEAFQFIFARKSLALRHNYLRACVFLGDDERCSIHPAKPGVCRTWPLDYNRQGELTWIRAHRAFIVEQCAFSPSSVLDMALQEQAVHIYNIERDLFGALIATWNQKFATQEHPQEEFWLEATGTAFMDYLLACRPDEEQKRTQMLTEKGLTNHGY